MKQIECPQCHSVFERQVKFCDRCRYQFTGREHRRRWPISRLVIVLSGLLVTIATTTVAYRVKRNLEANTPKLVFAGSITRTRTSSVCASSREVLEQMEQWSARNDTGEVARLMIQSDSVFIDKDTLVKVLEDTGILSRQHRIRIVSGAKGDPRVERECWISAETI